MKRLPSKTNLLQEERPSKLMSPSPGELFANLRVTTPTEKKSNKMKNNMTSTTWNSKRVFAGIPPCDITTDEEGDNFHDSSRDSNTLGNEVNEEKSNNSDRSDSPSQRATKACLVSDPKRHLNVSIAGFARVSRGETFNAYTTYQIKMCTEKASNQPKVNFPKWAIYRRYSAFLTLKYRLEKICPAEFLEKLPALPSKSVSVLGHNDEFLVSRACGLENWLVHAINAWKTYQANNVDNNCYDQDKLEALMVEFLTEEADQSPLRSQDKLVEINETKKAEEKNTMEKQQQVQQQESELHKNNSNENTNCANAKETNKNTKQRTTSYHDNSKLIGMSHKRNMHSTGNSLESYKMLKVVGKGSFGKVILAATKHCTNNKGKTNKEKKNNSNSHQSESLVAIKVLEKASMIKRKQATRLEIERRCMELCSCPFVVGLHSAFATKTHLFLVQEYCSAGEMFFHLDLQGKFTPKLARFYAAECAIALGHLHSHGIVYRDLKPENLMISKEGHLKIVDFGLAKISSKISATKGAKSFVGTREYLSPEMVAKSEHGFAVDWWSLGMVLYEMLTGLPPWYDENPKVVMQRIALAPLVFPAGQVSQSTRRFLRGLLQKNPSGRLGSNGGLSEIESDPYFDCLDFQKLRKKLIKPPFIPKLDSPSDTSFFDKGFTSLSPVIETKRTENWLQDVELVSKAEKTGIFDGFAKAF